MKENRKASVVWRNIVDSIFMLEMIPIIIGHVPTCVEETSVHLIANILESSQVILEYPT